MEKTRIDKARIDRSTLLFSGMYIVFLYSGYESYNATERYGIISTILCYDWSGGVVYYLCLFIDHGKTAATQQKSTPLLCA